MTASSKPRFAVDWDGTCVTDAWPEMGTWIEGAPEALHRMLELGSVTIHTCRIAPVAPDETTWLNPLHVLNEIAEIRTMLNVKELYNVEIHTKPWKPPADFYIDNKAIRFRPDMGWGTTMSAVEHFIEEERGRALR